jgi:BASS family bile acid:Na+ symporter
MAVQALIPLVITLSLVGLIVTVGLDAKLDDLVCVLRRPLLLAKAVLAVNVVVPVAAMLLVLVFPLTPAARAGVLLMAVSPVPPLVPGKQVKTGAEKSYAYGVYTALILLAVVIVPATVAALGRVYGVQVALPVPLVARNVILTVLLPLAAGVAIQRLAPALARRILPLVKAVATVLLFLAIAPLLVVAWPAVMGLAGNGTILAMALTAAIGLAAGHLLGGPDRANRGALAIAACIRHPGIALMIAKANNADRSVSAAILGMLLVGAVVASLYQLWLKRRSPLPAAVRTS